MKRRGFTLVEVLVAILLLALVGGAVASVLVSNVRLDADGRIRERALNATSSWIERFKAKTLSFSYFQNGRTYPYGYHYSNDSAFVAAGDPNPAALDREWGDFKFNVDTDLYNSQPRIWRVKIQTTYKAPGGKEKHFEVQTLIRQ